MLQVTIGAYSMPIGREFNKEMASETPNRKSPTCHPCASYTYYRAHGRGHRGDDRSQNVDSCAGCLLYSACRDHDRRSGFA